MLTKKIQKLNLQSYSVFHECNPTMDLYFQVSKIKNRTLGLGKHAFEISIATPDPYLVKNTNLSGLFLKEKSNILFEVVDYSGNTIFSSLTTLQHVNGSSFGYIQINEDILDNKKYISNGPAKLILIGELTGNNLPDRWKNSYNIRKVIPFNIKKQSPNDSFILFEGQPNSTSSVSFNDITLEASDENYRKFDPIRSYKYRHLHYFDNLHTYGGNLDSIDIYKKSHTEAPSKMSWEFVEKILISGSQELLTKTLYPLSSSFIDKTYEWAGNFSNYGNDLEQWYYNGDSPFVSVDTNMLQGQTSTYYTDLGAQSIRIRGDVSVHTPLIRKTVTDEQFDLKLLYSGSGAYAVLASKNKSALEIPVNGSFTDNENIGRNPSNKDWDVIVHEKFTDFNPYTRSYPKEYGNYNTDITGHYDKVKFIIPKDTYFVVRLMGAQGYTSSFADVSVKHTVRNGEHPPVWLHSSNIPKQVEYTDNIEYYYKFLNSKNETSKNYTIFPVRDVDTRNTLENYEPPQEIISRNVAHAALKVKNKGKLSSGINSAIYTVANPSGSYWSQVPSGTPGNTAGITAIGTTSDGNEVTTYASIGVQALGMVTVNPESSDPKLLFSSGKYHWNTGSLWSGYFGGDTGGGDAYFSQNVAIGSGFSFPTEHPTHALHVKGDIRIEGDMIAEQYIVSSSVTHITELKKSGSTEFGDSSDDTHIFSGSVVADRFHSRVQGTPGADLTDVNDTVVGHLRLGRTIAGGSVTPAAISAINNRDTSIQFPQGQDEIYITASSFRVNAHITASGDISASGTITANSFVGTLTGQASSVANNLTAGTGVDFGNDSFVLQSYNGSAAKTLNLDLTEVISSDGDNRVLTSNGDGTLSGEVKLTFDGSDLTIAGDIADVGNITASGDYSGSSTSTGSFGHVMIGGSNIGTFISSSAALDGFGSGGGGSADNLGNHTATQDLNLDGNDIFSIQHITASGNISASKTDGVHTFGGKVGIGTADPDTHLHILGDDEATLKLDATSGEPAIFFAQSDNAKWEMRAEANIFQLHDYTAGKWVFNIKNEKVGIGTLTPPSTLTVEGDISASGDLLGIGKLYLTGNDSDDSYMDQNLIQLQGGNSTVLPSFNLLTQNASLSTSGFNWATSSAAHDIQYPMISFRGWPTNNAGTSYPPAGSFTFTSGSIVAADSLNKSVIIDLHTDTDGARLGIRKKYPTTALEVNGAISASGNFYLNVGNAPDVKIGRNVAGSLDGIAVKGDISASGDLYLTDNQYIYLDSPTTTDNRIRYSSVADVISIKTEDVFFDVANGVGIGTSTPPKPLTVNGDISGSVGYLNTGHHGNQTTIKILPRDFLPSDDTGRPAMVEEDVVGQLKIRLATAGEVYASVEIPTGFKATHVMIYSNDASLTVSVVEGNINSASVTAKGSGNPNTEINITDVTATDTNFLWVGVAFANALDYVYGGYVTIEKA